LDEMERDRIKKHQFHSTHLNQLFFLLNDFAQQGLRISPLVMFFLANPFFIKLGVSLKITDYFRRKFENINHPIPISGEAVLDFSIKDYSCQLGQGWHGWEKEGGFRWTNRGCTFYLFPAGQETCLELRGIIPDLKNYGRPEVDLELRQEQKSIYKHRWLCAESFQLKVPLPRKGRRWKLPLTFHLECSATFSPASLGTSHDNRELGVVLTYIGLV
jgi:hypothetical protein